MRLDQNPIYRKEIVPWYDSEIACLLVIVTMVLSLLFSLVGVFTAQKNPAFHSYTWVPILAIFLSGFVVASTILRLIRRYLRRTSDTP